MTDLKVKVSAGYTDVAETDDPKLCAQILSLIALHAVDNPRTPEQQAVDAITDQKDAAEARIWAAEDRAKQSDKKIEELRLKIDELQANALRGELARDMAP